MIRYWQELDGNTAQLVVVSSEAIYAQRIDANECRRRLDRLQAGEAPAAMFGPQATRIPLASITCVQSRRGGRAIEFSLRGGKHARTVVQRIPDADMCAEILVGIAHVLLTRPIEGENPCPQAQRGLDARIQHWLARLAASPPAIADVENQPAGLKTRIAPTH